MIVLKNISKRFEERQVLDDISFHIAPKENVGIIGLNGAGKTTLLNVIAGILKPDAGFIRINKTENVLSDYDVLRDIAYVSGTRSQLWEDLKVRESFENCVMMYRIRKETARARLAELEEIFEIAPFLNALPKSLSLGERMRCELVYALLSEPKLLMLDEALIGLDVSIKHKILQYFQRYRKEKKSTIIFTSHNLAEIEKLCDRIILIDAGKIIFDGSVDRIMKEFSPLYHMEVRVAEHIPDFEDLPLEKFCVEKDRLEIVYDKQKIETAQILKHIMEKSKVEDIRLYEPDLEGTIRKIYELED